MAARFSSIKLPDEVTDDEAVLLSDIFPTGYFGADLADVGPGDVVAVFGCGPVGQFAVISAFLMGAGRVFAVDSIPDRLQKAAELGAENVDFAREDPVEKILELTADIGADRVIDAVGINAVDKAGTLGIIGVYPPNFRTFPIGMAMNRNLTLNMGNCNHRKYIPHLLELVRSGAVAPQTVLTRHEPLTSALDAYKQFDTRQDGWLKVALAA